MDEEMNDPPQSSEYSRKFDEDGFEIVQKGRRK